MDNFKCVDSVLDTVVSHFKNFVSRSNYLVLPVADRAAEPPVFFPTELRSPELPEMVEFLAGTASCIPGAGGGGRS